MYVLIWLYTYVESQPTDLKIVEDLPLHIGLSADVEEHVYATITHSLQTENSPLLDLSSRCNKKTASFNLSSTKLKSDNKPCVTSTVQRSPVSSLLFSMKQNHSVISWIGDWRWCVAIVANLLFSFKYKLCGTYVVTFYINS